MQQPPPAASLTACNEQLVEALQDLRSRRAEVNRDVLLAEKEKGRLQREIATLNDRLGALTSELAAKLEHRAEYDRTIRETEVAYAKIVESSETLLRVLRREGTHLQQQQQQRKGPPAGGQQGVGSGQGAAAVTGTGHARRGLE